VSRLEKAKRVDLAIDAMLHVDPSIKLLVAGDGASRQDLQRQIVERGLSDRVTLLGRVSDEEIITLYSGALAILFAPYQEDYGYVTLEAFLSSKPVITATDSGGPLEFITDGVSGLVREPTPEALGAAVRELAANRARAAELGAEGKKVAEAITWEGVVEKLVRAAD
jgi:glycosyltransferase involved in cell wall biosynthesis